MSGDFIVFIDREGKEMGMEYIHVFWVVEVVEYKNVQTTFKGDESSWQI